MSNPTIESLDELLSRILDKAKRLSDVQLATLMCGMDKEENDKEAQHDNETSLSNY